MRLVIRLLLWVGENRIWRYLYSMLEREMESCVMDIRYHILQHTLELSCERNPLQWFRQSMSRFSLFCVL